jgi:hypothetical protein
MFARFKGLFAKPEPSDPSKSEEPKHKSKAHSLLCRPGKSAQVELVTGRKCGDEVEYVFKGV